MRLHGRNVARFGQNEQKFAVIFCDDSPEPESLLCRKPPRLPQAKCSQKSARPATIKLIVILLVFLLQQQQQTGEATATRVRPERRHVSSRDEATTSGQDSSARKQSSTNIRCSSPSDEISWSFGSPPQSQQQLLGAPASREQERLLGELGDYFNLNATAIATEASDSDKTNRQQQLPHLPRPSNLTVLILSWYPPILKLSWNLNELDQPWELVDPSKYDFYQAAAAAGLGEPSASSALNKSSAEDNRELRNDKFDSELALNTTGETDGGGGDEAAEGTEFTRHLRTLRTRRELVEKSLTCFQVTYNIVNSRFRVIEEYPAHLRSIHLERVQPATEYNLRVSAVYLNGRFRRTSERVAFITPTDNESRRFKENTYRPIHSYPDELREPLIGLAQVRCEELTLVGIALFFWLATICLFFNKWGKIRMLEPYQPAYREQLDVGVAVGGPATPGVAGQLLGSTPPLGGNITPNGGPGGLLNVSSGSSYNLAHQQLVAQSSNATTGGRHTPSLTSECSRVIASPLCQVVDSLCMTGSPAQPQVSATNCPVSMDENGKRESLGPVPGGGPMSTAAAAARKSSMMILCGSQRFGGAGSCGGATGPTALDQVGGRLPKSRRATITRPDLNYLFQSKAQALAKASLWWPEAAAAAVGPVAAAAAVAAAASGKASEPASLTAQKFKQGLYRAKFSSTNTSATTDFETLRRLGKCLAARRQLARPGAGAAGSFAATSPRLIERLAAQSCDVTDQKQQQTQLSDPQLRLLAQMRNSRQRAQQRLQQQQQQQVANEPAASSSNKSSGVSFESATNQTSEDLEPRQVTPGKQQRTPTSGPCERSVSSGGNLVTRFIRRNHAVDLTSPRDSPRNSFRATGTQSLDQSTSDSLALLQAAERKLATCSPSSCTVEEEEEEEEAAEDEPPVPAESHYIYQPTGGSQEQVGAENRLRRLQFLSKLHQHQQIAQSVSSTTLNRQHQQQQAYEASSKANSLSLDSRELAGGHQHQQSVQPPAVALQQAAEQRKVQSKVPSHLEIVRPPEHHILIEPPSPPNNKFAGYGSPGSSEGRPSPLPPPAEFCASPGSLETLSQQARPSGRCRWSDGASQPAADVPPGMRPSVSAFAVIEHQADACRNKRPTQEITAGNNREQAMRASRSETRIDPDTIAQHYDHPPRLEICLNNDNGDEQHQAANGRFVVVSSTSEEDDEGPAPPAVQIHKEDAFAKLADSYRASTERRLACARSLAHLSSLATAAASPPTAANYCPCGAHCATSAQCACCPACDDQTAAAHQSLGADTDQVAVCSCHAAAAAPSSRLFSIGQQQQQHAHSQRPNKRTRLCSHCGSIECASQQAAMALHQMCALRNKQTPVELGVGTAAAASPMRPRMSSVFAACPTYARSHRDSFAMLRALSQRRSKSAEDIAYLSSLVLQIWAREPNPLLQSASQLQLSADLRRRPQRKYSSSTMNLNATLAVAAAATATPATTGGAHANNRRQSAGHHHCGRTLESAAEIKRQRKRPRSSLTVANL